MIEENDDWDEEAEWDDEEESEEEETEQKHQFSLQLRRINSFFYAGNRDQQRKNENLMREMVDRTFDSDSLPTFPLTI